MKVSLAPEKSGITCELKFVFFFFLDFSHIVMLKQIRTFAFGTLKTVSHASAIIKRLKGITAD